MRTQTGTVAARAQAMIRRWVGVIGSWSALTLVLAVAATAGAAGLAAWLGTHYPVLRVERVEIRRWPAAFEGLRLLHVSDLHARSFGARERRVIRLAAAAVPDVIAVTGDLSEPAGRGRPASLGPPVRVLAELSRVAPTFAILGNNDVRYPKVGQEVDTEALVSRLAAAGVTVLRNRAVRIGVTGARDSVYVIGLDDNYLGWDDLDAALRGVPRDAVTILLAHSPDIVLDRDLSGLALVLAGHTHGGQIRLPLFGSVETQTRGRRYVQGLYPLEEGSWLHVSGGVGVSGLRMRFLVPPSVTLLILGTA